MGEKKKKSRGRGVKLTPAQKLSLALLDTVCPGPDDKKVDDEHTAEMIRRLAEYAVTLRELLSAVLADANGRLKVFDTGRGEKLCNKLDMMERVTLGVSEEDFPRPRIWLTA